ncbi:MAG: hypothetical protein IJB22_08660 [Clostridia bacterium]|nr:hypothetical protein [Clostridia bacterium]MBQ7113795.1 hypothetical protein [Clostridia bacterium]
MIFYNQNDYTHIPYPSAGFPNENIEDSGCGVCSASMVVENLTGQKFPIKESTAFALQAGARDDDGTDMEKLAPALCERFGLSFEATDDTEKVLAFLNAGEGMVIANPGGDREGHVGLFTTTGHYIVLAAARQRTVMVLDPSLSPTKFEKEGRRGMVFVDGVNIYCDIDAVKEDCLNRSPAFYLFKKA